MIIVINAFFCSSKRSKLEINMKSKASSTICICNDNHEIISHHASCIGKVPVNYTSSYPTSVHPAAAGAQQGKLVPTGTSGLI